MNKKALLPLIGLFLLVTGIVLPGSAYAQISEGGTPTSFKYQNTLKSDLPTVQIPINFSVEDLKTVDRWQVSQGAPLKVGVLLPTDLTIDNAGSWNTLPDGKRVWRLQVQAKDAIALMLSFRDFYIPENGKLFIYSSDKTHLIGAFTHHTNPPTKEYATEFLAGDKIILEYEAGISENEHPRIAIDAVGYGYNHLHVSRTMADTGPGTSGSCMVNINCEEGEAWQTEKNGVCQMTLPIGNYIYICSGALVNNTAEDLKLSASYTDNKESAVATTSIYVYELKIPTDVTTSTDGKNILVKWKEPIYQQMIYWGNGTAYLSLGFKQPFYFGQRWNKEDLKPLHGHLVESVSFIPTSGSSYTLNIIQGKRKYVQKLTNLPFDKLIEIPLKEPFVIDASQELIIAFHAEAKLSTAYPAVMDEGPAVNGKGNLISFDGETWEYLYEPSENENENYDFNFFLAATVSSKTKDIPTIKTASNDTTLLSKSSAMPILTRISEVGSSLRSSQASAFPTITGYNIYRNGSKIGNVPNKFITQYIDKQAPTGSILYQVSTLYGKDESKKADADKEVNVGNEKIILSETTISPTVFTDQVELFGNEKVDLLEVITLDGKTVIRQKNPGKIVYTGSLSSGIYIFRIHTDGKAKTMKAQKIN